MLHRIVRHAPRLARCAAAISTRTTRTATAAAPRPSALPTAPTAAAAAAHPYRLFTSSADPLRDADVITREDSLDRGASGVGSASPWSTFDAWGANELQTAEQRQQLDDDMMMLSKEALAVGTDPDADPDDEDVSACLEAYDRILASKSQVHFGYPYNLRYNHEELYPFMKYVAFRFPELTHSLNQSITNSHAFPP